MASIRQPGPVNLHVAGPVVDQNTLCRATSPRPGPIGVTAGRDNWLEDLSARFQPAERSLLSKGELDDYLRDLGKPGAPPLVRQRVLDAAVYFERHFAARSFDDLVGYLRGIDFSLEVTVCNLAAVAPLDTILVQYTAGGQPGNFFTRPGWAIDRLGIARGSRQFRRYRVVACGVDVLVSTAAPVSDTWTWGRTRNVYSPVVRQEPWQSPARAGELVGGGAQQLVVPDPVGMYLRSQDDNVI